MDSTLIATRFLFGALALVMFGLGLTLRVADFRRLLQSPKAVAIAATRWPCLRPSIRC
ncbi:hypothetical protein [Acidovorax sp. SUPP3334]|uniref:hypothetical protein n=1 Tax=Acidovorax sp. SUPP3334 TaxID=2920881 RepID=UPI0023DE1AD8|nr:hypothetical protein [Acidovorax sp. SUPP3334]GKT23060.1 hypothetical protein AVHM3334_10415 [Acidovorax sp. SUPP3334]